MTHCKANANHENRERKEVCGRKRRTGNGNGTAQKKPKPAPVVDLDDDDEPTEAQVFKPPKDDELPNCKRGWYIVEQERIKKQDEKIARLRELRLQRDAAPVTQKRRA